MACTFPISEVQKWNAFLFHLELPENTASPRAFFRAETVKFSADCHAKLEIAGNASDLSLLWGQRQESEEVPPSVLRISWGRAEF